MKGFIVGYIASWADHQTTQIAGYYTSWGKAIGEGKKLERTNLDRHRGRQIVFIAEVEVNRTYQVKESDSVYWYRNYFHHVFETERGVTTLKASNGKEQKVELQQAWNRPKRNRNNKKSPSNN